MTYLPVIVYEHSRSYLNGLQNSIRIISYLSVGQNACNRNIVVVAIAAFATDSVG
jgi:hypothetical protein